MMRNVAVVARQAYTCLCKPSYCHSHRVCNATLYQARQIHKTSVMSVLDKDVDKRAVTSASLKTVKEETPSEEVEIKLEGMMASGIPFPSLETHSMVIDGTRYDELPIVHIQATRNNTIVALTDFKGDIITSSSAGAEGFRNARKGTNIAGQAVGLTIGKRAVERGLKFLRVAAREYGPGRLPAIKGLQMSGLQIVSITDSTRAPFNTGRPRKQKRL
ncbi:uncharacterized protein LOC135482734 [Lineus longissimus]|uniref:uncharacterized protein LOC135482734 n=1 Tax=Lineus longissimus TaxID=88925 RepID=UPI002B4D362B